MFDDFSNYYSLEFFRLNDFHQAGRFEVEYFKPIRQLVKYTDDVRCPMFDV